MTVDPERLARLCLLSVPGLGPARVRWLVGDGACSTAWERLCSGRRPSGPAPRRALDTWDELVVAARRIVPADVARRLDDTNAIVLQPGDVAWPFANDPEPPTALIVRGDPSLVDRRPSVAIVGTRRPTGLGRAIAADLGRDLAEAGVVVVSGLALGVDVAAHRGALDVGGPTVAVVATGVDRPYPVSHAEVWEQVAHAGAIVSEAGFGVGPSRWRFPARNRIIAALADVVVVVESQLRGGALSTASEALDRGVTVAAVPGSVRSPASDGTNALLVDGAAPVRGSGDVLDLLALSGGGIRDRTTTAPLDLLDAEVARGGCSVDVLVALHGGAPADALAEVSRRLGDGRWVRSGSIIELGAHA